MRRFTASVAIVLLFAFGLNAQNTLLIWNGNKDTLIEFLNSDNENKIEFALQNIIQDPELVKANKVGIDIYRIFRSHQNDDLRQMALVALYRLEHYWLLKNLKEDLYRENNIRIRKQILSILDRMPVLRELH